MTEEAKNTETTSAQPEVQAAENPIQQDPQPAPQQQVDQPSADIYKVAVLACFGSGSRPDAIERMKGVGIQLLITAIQESTTPAGKMTIFNQTVGGLAEAAGVQIQQVGEKPAPESPKGSAPEAETAAGTAA